MIAIPAVDIRDGACVQLVGGSYAAERVRLDDPPAVAREWARLGFRRLHVVDLDAATAAGNNETSIDTILRERTGAVQVGGGVRTTERVRQLVEAGASNVIVGTRALEEPEWLADVATRYPCVIIVAADVRERHVVTRGWTCTLARNVLDVVTALNVLPLAGLLVTAVHLEGQMRGADLALMEDVIEETDLPVIASGEIATLSDLHALERRGVAAAVIGMALYTGGLDARAVAQEFGE